MVKHDTAFGGFTRAQDIDEDRGTRIYVERILLLVLVVTFVVGIVATASQGTLLGSIAEALHAVHAR